MSVQKIALEVIQRMDDAPQLRILKSDGMGFPLDPDGVDNLDERIDNFEKFRPGKTIGIYDFFSDPVYYTKMYTIVECGTHEDTGVRVNV